MLDAKKLDCILLGSIQSDYLECRFGWYRQLCGANYFNSVLQFLQAEKKIRLRSLVKLGFNMSSIKDIFNESNQAIVFYTAGYIGKSIMKNVKCKDCIKMLSADCHLIASDFEGETANANRPFYG